MQAIIPGLWQIDEIGERVGCFLWEWSKGITLIDAGFPGDANTILAVLHKHGYPIHSLRRILLTHVDLDHSGGAAALQRATGARVACHTAEKSFLENPARRHPPGLLLRLLLWPMTQIPAYRQAPITPDELLTDGQELPEGFRVIHTPGHSPGHIALLHRTKRLLICGDALVNSRGKLRVNTGPFTPDKRSAQRSIFKLTKQYGDDFDTMVFGHGPPILQNGGKRVKALMSGIFSTDV